MAVADIQLVVVQSRELLQLDLVLTHVVKLERAVGREPSDATVAKFNFDLPIFAGLKTRAVQDRHVDDGLLEIASLRSELRGALDETHSRYVRPGDLRVGNSDSGQPN